MILKLDMKSSVPIYVQLRNEIVMGVGRGEIKIGESLPTVRQLSEDIGVNMMTVNKAYGILKAEGFIEIDRRHGAKIAPSIKDKSFETRLEAELSLLFCEAQLKGYNPLQTKKLCEALVDALKIDYMQLAETD